MTYRDDLQAARMRREALNRELRALHGRMDEYEALARREQALAQELAQCARDVDQARARAPLPLLQQVRVASPCKERWDDMTGDERVRFCGRCEKNVYDLSALTVSQAEALLRERGASMCVRFFRRSDGTLLTSDCPVGSKRKRFWRRVTTAAVASGLAAGITMTAATIDLPTTGSTLPVPAQEEELLGVMIPPTAHVHADPPEIEQLDQRLADTQARLAAATAQKAAIQQELDRLYDQAHSYRQRRKRGDTILEQRAGLRTLEISDACRKNPLDC